MSSSGPGESTSKKNLGRADRRFLGFLHVVALIVLGVAAVGSVGLMLSIGHRNPSRVLLFLFVIWDLSPFIGLVAADIVSKRWSVLTRATLYVVMVIVALGSLAFYGDVFLRPRQQPAFVFLVVPLGSWLFMTIAVAIAAIVSGRPSGRDAGV